MLKHCLLACLALLFVGALSKPACCEPYHDEGVRLYNKGDYREAIRYFDQALKVDPKNKTALYYRGLSFHQLKDLGNARVQYRHIYQNFPGSQEAANSALVLEKIDPDFLREEAKSGKHTPAQSTSTSTDDLNPYELSDLSDAEWQSLPSECKIPFSRGLGGHLFVDAQVNGHPLKMMFDTGASGCVISQDQLASMRISVPTTGPQVKFSGVGGVTGGTAMQAEIRVGPIKRHLVIGVLAQSHCEPLLGETFFKAFDYEIDNQGGFIRFIKKSRDGKKGSSVPFDTINIPFQQVGNNFVVNTKVNGRDCPMYFDTGAFGIAFSLGHLLVLGLSVPRDADMVVSSGVSGATGGYRFNVDRIELGPIVQTNVPVTVLREGPPLPLLGQSFFGGRRFTIDNQNHVIKFWR